MSKDEIIQTAEPWIPLLEQVGADHPRSLDVEIALAMGWRVSQDPWWNWHPGPRYDPPSIDDWCIRKDGRNDKPCNEALPVFTAEMLRNEIGRMSQGEHTPLSIGRDNWRSRWLVLPRWGVLHRVAEIEWDDPDNDEMISGPGTTLCGRTGRLHMPGFMSRMGLKRCPLCCRRMGIPQGDGAPFNEGIMEPGDER